MKDPSFDFYYQDFLVGTSFMSLEATGAYIKCLCHQAHKNSISRDQIKAICLDDESIITQILPKFTLDNESGLLYNERCRFEVEKKRKYASSRSKNRKGSVTKEPEAKMRKVVVVKEKKVVERNVILPFESERFKAYWKQWKEYKATEHAFKYKSEQSEQAALMGLSKLAAGNEETAIKIILQSMENGWKGFFEIKTNTLNGTAKKSIGDKISESNSLVDAYVSQSRRS